MNVKTLFITLLLFTISNVYAQKKAHIVKLDPPFVKAIETDFYISKIIDNRTNKENIGVIQKGLGNKKVPANFEEDLSIHLLDFLKKLVQSSEDKTPLALQVNQLSIYERTSAFTEMGGCEVRLEFSKEENGQLISFGEFTAVVENKGTSDVTARHDERIIEALTTCINDFSKTDWKNTIPTTIAENDAIQANYTYDYIVKPKKGLYRSFNAFLKNAPFDTSAYFFQPIKKKQRFERYQVYDNEEENRIKNLFGFSDGEHFYLSAMEYTTSYHFIKSQFIGRFIYFEDQIYSPGAAIAFGLIGAAASTKHTGIVLDTQTGLTSIVNTKTIEALIESYPDLQKMYENSNKGIVAYRTIIEQLNKLDKK
ncbi:MAG: hypothetical protein R3E32_10750 [Chitinophagales bacterium]